MDGKFVNENELFLIKQTLKEAISFIVQKEYEAFEKKYMDEEYYLSRNDFFIWLKEYCKGGGYERFITMPPDTAFLYENLHLYEYKPKCFRLDFDLWTDGTQSDLTLQCTFDFRHDGVEVIFEDLHVM